MLALDIVVARVEPQQDLPGFDVLVVGDQQCGDRAADPGGDLGLVGVDECVVRAFIVTRVPPIERASAGDTCKKHEPDQASQQSALPRGRCSLLRFHAGCLTLPIGLLGALAIRGLAIRGLDLAAYRVELVRATIHDALSITPARSYGIIER